MRTIMVSLFILFLQFRVGAVECSPLLQAHLATITADDFRPWSEFGQAMANLNDATVLVRVNLTAGDYTVETLKSLERFKFLQSAPSLNVVSRGAQYVVMRGTPELLLQMHKTLPLTFPAHLLSFQTLLVKSATGRHRMPKSYDHVLYTETNRVLMDLKMHQLRDRAVRVLPENPEIPLAYHIPKSQLSWVNDSVLERAGVQKLGLVLENAYSWMKRNQTVIRQPVVVDFGQAWLVSKTAERALQHITDPGETVPAPNVTATPEFLDHVQNCLDEACSTPPVKVVAAPVPLNFSDEELRMLAFLSRQSQMRLPKPAGEDSQLATALYTVIAKITLPTDLWKLQNELFHATGGSRTDEEMNVATALRYGWIVLLNRLRPHLDEASISILFAAPYTLANIDLLISKYEKLVAVEPIVNKARFEDVLPRLHGRLRRRIEAGEKPLQFSASAIADAQTFGLNPQDIAEMLQLWTGEVLPNLPPRADLQIDPQQTWTILIKRKASDDQKDVSYFAQIADGQVVKLSRPEKLYRIESAFYNRMVGLMNIPNFDFVIELPMQNDANIFARFDLHIDAATAFKEIYKHDIDVSKLPIILRSYQIFSTYSPAGDRKGYRLIRRPGASEDLRLDYSMIVRDGSMLTIH